MGGEDRGEAATLGVTERTPEQVTADNAFEDALRGMVRAYELVSADEVLTTWVLVGASQGLDEGRTNYFHTFPGGVLPTHIAVGLLRVAETQLLHGDDEE